MIFILLGVKYFCMSIHILHLFLDFILVKLLIKILIIFGPACKVC